MLNLEDRLHAERGAFFDLEWLLLQLLDGTGSGKVNGEVFAVRDLEGEGEDNTASLIGRVNREGGRVGEAERCFPPIKGLIFLVYGS